MVHEAVPKRFVKRFAVGCVGPLKERWDTFCGNGGRWGGAISLHRRGWSRGMRVLCFCCLVLALTSTCEPSVSIAGRKFVGAAGKRGGERGAAIGGDFLGPPFSQVPPPVGVLVTRHYVHRLTDRACVSQEWLESSEEPRYEAPEGLRQGTAPPFFLAPACFLTSPRPRFSPSCLSDTRYRTGTACSVGLSKRSDRCS